MRLAAMILALVMALSLSACGHTAPEEPPTVREPEHVTPAEEEPVPGEIPVEEAGNIRLGFSIRTQGEWPLDCTLETLEFEGDLDDPLSRANEALAAGAEKEWQRYLDCCSLDEETRIETGAGWADIWAYPVTGERYLNAVWTCRERMEFRTGEDTPKSSVGSLVYDREEGRFLTLEDAFALAGTDEAELEGTVEAFLLEHQLGECDGIDSLGFCVTDDGQTVFMIGVLLHQPAAPAVSTFFAWTDGVVEWTYEHPLPLYLVDTTGEELACLQGMGQYDGAAVLNEMEAAQILSEIVEVQDYLSQGMVMLFDGITEWIDSEYCVCIALGTDNGETVVREIYYAVSDYSVYRLDPLTGNWEVVGFG